MHALEGKVEGMLEPLLEKDEDAPSVASSDENSEYSAESSTWSVDVKPSGSEMIKAGVGKLNIYHLCDISCETDSEVKLILHVHNILSYIQSPSV